MDVPTNKLCFGFMLTTIWDSYFDIIRGYLFLLKV